MAKTDAIQKSIIIVSTCMFICVVFGLSHQAKALNIGDPMPDFNLKDYDGKEYSLAQFKGKIVVLEFCSQECPYSRGADPDIAELHAKYSTRGVVFLGIDSH
ncbi:MAG: redoxin domain-containing protein, partial [Candidatus Hydrogenedens sp.]